MEALHTLKEMIPDYAKDVRLNIDSVIVKSSLTPNQAIGCAIAAAFATGNGTLTGMFAQSGVLDDTEIAAAKTAGALMGLTNTWYGYLDLVGDAELSGQPAGLRMLAYGANGGVDKLRFEMWTLASSIVGKCHACVRSHVGELKGLGVTVLQLREIGRIAAVVVATANVLFAEGRT